MKNIWYIRQAMQKAKSGGYRGLKATADIILDEAQRITPLDTGELETSGRVDGDYNSLTVYISFEKIVNGVDVAVIQHEVTWYNHLPGKQAKYLEQPFNQLGPALLPSVVGSEIQKALS